MTKLLGIGVSYAKDTGYQFEQTQCIREVLVGLRLKHNNPSRTPIGDYQDSDDEGDLLPSDGTGTPERPTVKIY